MTRELPVVGRPTTSQLLQRLLETPDLARHVQALPAPALAKLVDRIGLEDAGEIVAFATTEQLAAVFDEDLWRSDRAGVDERFDADRFLVWLDVMVEAGDRFVASRLSELPTELVTLAFHRHLLVLDMDALVSEMEGGGDDVDRIEKALADCLFEELEEYRLIARRHEGWDNLLTAILALDRDHHDTLVRILERCASMSAEYIGENGGLYDVLTSEEMLEQDVAADREDRRAEAGHVAPSSAAAFLELGRRSGEASDRDPLTKAYFRSIAIDRSVAPSVTSPDAASRPNDLVALLGEVEVVERPPLLTSTSEDPRVELPLLRGLRELAEQAPEQLAARSEELAYLANVLASGCAFQGRRFRPAAAIQAAIAVTNLGLELALADAPAMRGPREISDVLGSAPADQLFRRGWHLLYVDVVCRAANAAVEWLKRGAADAADPRSVADVAARLEAAAARGAPWEAGRGLALLRGMLDAPTVDMFVGLVDECPTMRGTLVSSANDFLARPEDVERARACIEATRRRRRRRR